MPIPATTSGRNTSYAFQNKYYQAGLDDPSVVPTDGTRGTLYLRVSTDGLSVIGQFIKNDNGITTNWVPFAGGGGFSMQVRDEGISFVTNPTFLNFIGAGVTAVVNGLGADITIAGGGGGISTVGVINSLVKSANGAVISGANIVFQTADSAFPGMVSLVAQTFLGNKTFNNPVSIVSQATPPVPAGSTAHFFSNISNLMAQQDPSGNVRVVNGIIQDEGVAVVTAPQFINFVGAGVTAAISGLGATVTIPGGGGGGAAPKIENRVITGAEALAKALTLVSVPATATDFAIAVEGVMQFLALDYSVAGSVVSWAGLGLDTIGVIAGDHFVISYKV